MRATVCRLGWVVVAGGLALGCGEATASRALCVAAAQRAAALELDAAITQQLDHVADTQRDALRPQLRRELEADAALQTALAAQQDAFLASCEGRPSAVVQCVIAAADRAAYHACLGAAVPGSAPAGSAPPSADASP